MVQIKNKDIEVVFVAPPGGDIGCLEQQLGLSFLQTVLNHSGISSTQFKPHRLPSLAEFACQMNNIMPTILGLTVYDSNIDMCRTIANVSRSVCKDLIIIAGGPSATFSPIEVMDRIGTDVCFRGAGEGTISIIAENIVGVTGNINNKLNYLLNVKNLVISMDGRHHFTEQGSYLHSHRSFLSKLDNIPSPYLAGFATDSDVGILTSRGCNQNCTYCNFAAISGRKIVFHGVDRVIDDIAMLKAYVDKNGLLAPIIPVFDDAFTLIPNRARKICEAIIQKGVQLPFGAMTSKQTVLIETCLYS